MPKKTIADPHAEPAERPAWFDPALHGVGPYGINRLADQALLDDDGLPANGTLRAAALAEAAAPAANVPAVQED